MNAILNALTLDAAGTAAFEAAFRAKFPMIGNADIVSAINTLAEEALASCTTRPFHVNGTFLDNHQDYGSGELEVPKGHSPYDMALRDVLDVRWFDGNQVGHAKLVDSRTGQLYGFEIQDFEVVFQVVLDAEKELGEILEPRKHKLSAAVESIATIALESGSDEHGEDYKLGVFLDDNDESVDAGKHEPTFASFMNTEISCEEIQAYLRERGNALQDFDHDGREFFDKSGAYFQLAYALEVFGGRFDAYLLSQVF